jgi:hypothetical protein
MFHVETFHKIVKSCQKDETQLRFDNGATKNRQLLSKVGGQNQSKYYLLTFCKYWLASFL